jgi:two-component system alkaline phosphatase synthesis response regulator PhoP
LSGQRFRVLVADDDPKILFFVETTLATDGLDVVTASSGAEAIRVATQERPDLVIVDVTMPGVDGHEVTRTLRGQPETKSIPIIMLTAHLEEEVAAKGFAGGADDYVTKPVSPALLRARVQTWLLRGAERQRQA